jgi:uncharacterized protein
MAQGVLVNIQRCQEKMMSPQESRLLQDFLDQLVQVKGITKDPQAEAMITQAVRQQPDAAYLLVQRALLQEQALEAAKAQIAALQSQAQGGRQGGFLDSASSWGNSVRTSVRPAVAPQAEPVYGSYAAPRASMMPSMLGGGGGSFLGNMAATAAGVVGGAFLFQGIENLLGHHGGAHGFGQQGQQGLAGLDNSTVDVDPGDTGGDASDLASDAGLDDISLDDDSSLL